MHPIRPGLEEGAILRVVGEHRKVMRADGTLLTRPDDIGVRVRYEQAGALELPTGSVMVTDPGRVFWHDPPIAGRRIEPGSYPVWSMVAETAESSRVALAVLQLTEERAVRHEPVFYTGDDREEYAAWQFTTIGVDSGTAGFVDASFAAVVHDACEQGAEDMINTIEQQLADDRRGRVVTLPGDVPMAIWSAGFGDGVYLAHWGYDTAGNACHLALDFTVVANCLHGPLIPRDQVGASLEYVPASMQRRRWWRFWR